VLVILAELRPHLRRDGERVDEYAGGFKMSMQDHRYRSDRAMLNPAAAHEVLHMTLAAFIATGFAWLRFMRFSFYAIAEMLFIATHWASRSRSPASVLPCN